MIRALKNCKYKYKNVISLSTLSFLVRLLKNPIKEHHLEPISKLKQKNGRLRIRVGEITGAIRIRNTAFIHGRCCFQGQIRSVVGQGRLVMDQRFKQFSGLT